MEINQIMAHKFNIIKTNHYKHLLKTVKSK